MKRNSGVFGIHSVNEISRPKDKHKINIQKKDFSLVADGNSIIYFSENDQTEYVICGSGLDKNFKLLDAQSWKQKINYDLRNLNGHFLIFKIKDDSMEILNDSLGLRELFFYKQQDKILFSTRLDWLVQYIENPCLNVQFLASFWNLESPLICSSLVQNVKLLQPGGKAVIRKNKLSIDSQVWSPDIGDFTVEEAAEMLDLIITNLVNSGKKVYLGLSGGIDSRVLLALLLDHSRDKWGTYTFGDASMLDVKVAKYIAKHYEFDFHSLHVNEFSNDASWGSWQDYAREMNCLIPCDKYHYFNYQRELPEDCLFIDGGKGAYMRRRLSNRLALLGKGSLLNRDIDGIMKYLILRKPGIFSSDLTKNWQDMIRQQISDLLQDMPDVDETGIGNWVDLYNIRYKTANTSYISQSRLDRILPSLMPYFQKSLLDIIFSISAQKRHREDTFRYILRKRKALRLIPLARYNTVIPFQYGKYSSLIWSKIMKRIIAERSNELDKFLLLNKEYNLSRIADSSFLNSSIYDVQKIKHEVEAFYKHETADKNLIVWWMTFDVWHKLIYEK